MHMSQGGLRGLIQSMGMGKRLVVLAIFGLALACRPASGAEWAEWRQEDLAYRMIVPTNATIVDREFGKGWFGVVANAETGESLFAFVQKGRFLDEAELRRHIEDYAGFQITDTTSFTAPEKGAWTWAKQYKLGDEIRFVWAVIGHGPAGSYAFFLTGLNEHLSRNRSAYERWLSSIEPIALPKQAADPAA